MREGRAGIRVLFNLLRLLSKNLNSGRFRDEKYFEDVVSEHITLENL